MKTRYSQSQWDQFLLEWQASGISQMEFCNHKNISITTFGKHRARQIRDEKQSEAMQSFVEVKPPLKHEQLQNQTLLNIVINQSGLIKLELNLGSWARK